MGGKWTANVYDLLSLPQPRAGSPRAAQASFEHLGSQAVEAQSTATTTMSRGTVHSWEEAVNGQRQGRKTTNTVSYSVSCGTVIASLQGMVVRNVPCESHERSKEKLGAKMLGLGLAVHQVALTQLCAKSHFSVTNQGAGELHL